MLTVWEVRFLLTLNEPKFCAGAATQLTQANDDSVDPEIVVSPSSQRSTSPQFAASQNGVFLGGCAPIVVVLDGDTVYQDFVVSASGNLTLGGSAVQGGSGVPDVVYGALTIGGDASAATIQFSTQAASGSLTLGS